MHRFANPVRFQRMARRISPLSAATAVLFLAIGGYFSLFASPADYQQGETVRIMYIHVPAAWMSLFIYGSMALSSAVGLIWRHPLADLVTRAAAVPGISFTGLCLATGALWGQPMWGTWWVWDARLTSMLILFFLYLGYLALVDAFDDPERGSKAGAILTLAGALNLPIIKFSVDWWNTLHQPASVFRFGGPTIDFSMLRPLMLMAVGFGAFFVWVLFLRLETAILDRKIQAAEARET